MIQTFPSLQHFNGVAFRHFDCPGTTPIVFFHGFLGSILDFERLLPVDRSWVFIEMPGHGGSEGFAFMSLKDQPFLAFSKVIDRLLDFLSITSCDLFGYSLGGRLAFSMAYYVPKRVRNLIIVSAHPGLLDPTSKEQRWRQDQELSRSIQSDFTSFLLDWHLKPLFNLDAYPDIRDRLISQRLKLSPVPISQCLLAFSLGLQPDVRSVFLSHPIVYCVGAADSAYLALSKQLAQAFPKQRIVVIPEAGHGVHLWPTGFRLLQELTH